MNFSIFALALIATIAACNAAVTFQPFVRSRYSLRWRKQYTTENTIKDMKNATESVNSKLFESETSSMLSTTISQDAITEDPPTTVYFQRQMVMETSSVMPVIKNVSVATHHPKVKTSTILPDYDYYENGDAEDVSKK